MNSSLLLLCALFSLATCFELFETAEKIEKLETELEDMEHKKLDVFVDLFGQIEQLRKYANNESKMRKRRAICGRKLTTMAIAVCGGLDRSPATDIDLSPVCCTTKSCDDQFIKKAMCPDAK
uniref:Secreted protein n=1 Tax=Caenorhabditis tropicalis TaxID=1561998 RepID=A0A1I7U5B1_9PELO